MREEFLAQMQAKLKEFDERLAQMETKPKPKGESAQLERDKTYFFLKASRAELAERLKQAQYTPDASWKEFKSAMQGMYDDMAKRMDEF